MPERGIIALDLDNTLLDSRKELSARNAAALERAAGEGMEIVPTTGRFFGGMPESVRELPYLRYAITINGAQVYDIARDTAVATCEIPPETALRIMAALDAFPVLYDCYQSNWGYMTAAMREQSRTFVPDPHYRQMVWDLRTPVPELKAYVREQGIGVQKIQVFTPDPALRDQLLRELPERFPETAISSAVPFNVEINAAGAHKGAAIRALAEYLEIDVSRVIAFGDGKNDVTMLRAAGIGVAMANSCPEALEAADRVTLSCDEDGVAVALEQLGL